MDDIEAIKQLKHRYFRGLDSQDWALYGACFADDIVVDLTRAGGGLYEGKPAFLAYATAMPLVQSVHQGHNAEIELTSADTATGIWALEDYNIWQDGSQNHGWGHYLESYVRCEGRWLIHRMALSYLRIERSTEQPVLVAGREGTAHLRGFRPAG